MSQSPPDSGADPDHAAPCRVFLGWETPPLISAAAWLVSIGRGADLSQGYSRGSEDPARGGQAGEGETDLERTLIVINPSRARRLLQGQLTDAAHDLGLSLVPPRAMITPGEAPSALALEPGLDLAGPCALHCAWREAIGSIGPSMLRALAPRSEEDAASWIHPLATIAMEACDQLALQLMTPGDAIEKLEALNLLDDEQRERLEALGAARDACTEILDACGLVDPTTRAMRAIREGAGPRPGNDLDRIVLIGVTEMRPLVRAALLEAGAPIISLIAAPPSHESWFDDFGRPNDRWTQEPLEIDDATIRFVAGPSEQARLALASCLLASGEYTAPEMVLATPDDEVRRAIVRESALARGIVVHDAAGRSLSATRCGTCLADLATWLDEASFDAFDALLRHPDIGAWLDIASADLPDLAADALEAMEQLGAMAPTTRRWEPQPGDCAAFFAWGLLRTLTEPIRAAPRPAGEWAEPIRSVLASVYADTTLDPDNPRERDHLAALEAVASACDDLASAPGADPIDGSAALRLVLDALDTPAPPGPASADAVDLVGWLELLLDPSPVLVLAGVNDPSLPSRSGADPILTEQFRARLGLPGDAERLARDSYLIRAVLAPRARATVIAGRQSADGEPLLPSRLLLREGSGRRVASRLLRAIKPGPDETPTPNLPLRASPVDASIYRCCQVGGEPIPKRLSVSAINSYKASPYGFYLSTVARLEESADRAHELDHAGFGSLIHEALGIFGLSEARDETSAQRIAEFLREALDIASRKLIDPNPASAIGVQLLAARMRLDAFSEMQAARRSGGWRILHAETDQSLTYDHDIDGEPITISGRIDRIDEHEERGLCAILDYKTSAKGDGPDKVHYRPHKRWVNLQLPLYRDLARSIIGDRVETASLGYITIPATEAPECKLATWSRDAELEAMEAFRQVVRDIRARRFDDPGSINDGAPARLAGVVSIRDDDDDMSGAAGEEDAS